MKFISRPLAKAASDPCFGVILYGRHQANHEDDEQAQ
jgi:hypothetical protein